MKKKQIIYSEDNSWYYNSHAKTHPSNVFIILYITQAQSNNKQKIKSFDRQIHHFAITCNVFTSLYSNPFFSWETSIVTFL